MPPSLVNEPPGRHTQLQRLVNRHASARFVCDECHQCYARLGSFRKHVQQCRPWLVVPSVENQVDIDLPQLRRYAEDDIDSSIPYHWNDDDASLRGAPIISLAQEDHEGRDPGRHIERVNEEHAAGCAEMACTNADAAAGSDGEVFNDQEDFDDATILDDAESSVVGFDYHRRGKRQRTLTRPEARFAAIILDNHITSQAYGDLVRFFKTLGPNDIATLPSTRDRLERTLDEQPLPANENAWRRLSFTVNGAEQFLYFRDLGKLLEDDLIPAWFEHLQFEYKMSEDGTLDEQWSGSWWRTTQDALSREDPAARLLALNIFVDETNAAKHAEMGAYPVYVTLGNIPIRMRKGDNARRVVAFLPQVEKRGKSDDGPQAAVRNTRLQHASLRALFEKGFPRAFQEGIHLPDKKRGVAKVALLIGDIKEFWRTFNLKASWQAPFPCPLCEVRRENAYDMPQTARLRSMRRAQAKGVDRGYGDLSGDLPHRTVGIDPFKHFFPDLLHCAELGLMRKILELIVTYITRRGKLAEFDRRMTSVPPFYGLRLPRYGASRSASKHERGQPLRSIFGVLPIIVADLVPDTTLNFLNTFIEHYRICRQPAITPRQLERLRALTPKIIDGWSTLGASSRPAGIKAHVWLFHVPHMIGRFGAPINADVGADERYHLAAFKRTVERNSNFRNVTEQAIARLRRTEATSQASRDQDGAAHLMMDEDLFEDAEWTFGARMDAEDHVTEQSIRAPTLTGTIGHIPFSPRIAAIVAGGAACAGFWTAAHPAPTAATHYTTIRGIAGLPAHCRSKYYGKPRFDVVEVHGESDNDPHARWWARLDSLFEVYDHQHRRHYMAAVTWFNEQPTKFLGVCPVLRERRSTAFDVIPIEAVRTSVHVMPHPGEAQHLIVNTFAELFVGHFRTTT